MNLYESSRIALRSLIANKLRSILTMLGIIIGVSAVIVLISAGQSVERYVVEQFASAGSNLLFVVPGQLQTGGGPIQRPTSVGSLTLGDANAVGDPFRVPDVVAVAPELTGGALISRGKKSTQIQVRGVTPSYPQVRSWYPTLGQFIGQADMEARSRVVVLGADVHADLFEPGEYPIDQTVRINNLVFQVIGVMERQGGSGLGNLDQGVFLPLTTAQDRLLRRKTVSGDYLLSVIYVSVRSQESMARAQQDIEGVLRERHRITYLDDDDFSVISQTDFITVFGNIVAALTVFLGAIAFISLLVGGIGIMNIMLVSVTERTREIGLRKAVGAKSRDIMGQFLMESVALALVGGLFGIALSAAGTRVINNLSDSFSVAVGTDAVVTAVGFSTAIGLLFGIYPAFRASRLNPIEALRYE